MLVSLFSCTTEKKANRYFKLHDKQAAKFCADNYPVIQHIDTVKVYKANNRDYTNEIDSLDDQVRDVAKTITYIDRTDTLALMFYRNKIMVLQRRIAELKAQYKPCKPDTLRITAYIRDSAREHYLQAKLSEAEARINELTADNTMLENRARKRLYWLIIACVAIGIGSFYKLKSFFI